MFRSKFLISLGGSRVISGIMYSELVISQTKPRLIHDIISNVHNSVFFCHLDNGKIAGNIGGRHSAHRTAVEDMNTGNF